MVHFLFLKFFRPFLILIFKNLFFKLLKKFNTKLINLILNIHHKYATHYAIFKLSEYNKFIYYWLRFNILTENEK
jgi:hypothetical protein